MRLFLSRELHAFYGNSVRPLNGIELFTGIMIGKRALIRIQHDQTVIVGNGLLSGIFSEAGRSDRTA